MVTANPIAEFQTGPFTVLHVINDYPTAKKLLSLDAFSGRRIHDYLAYHYFVDPPTPKGIGNTTGHNWSVQRRFGVRTLCHLGGFGKASLESLMAPEIDRLVA